MFRFVLRSNMYYMSARVLNPYRHGKEWGTRKTPCIPIHFGIRVSDYTPLLDTNPYGYKRLDPSDSHRMVMRNDIWRNFSPFNIRLVNMSVRCDLHVICCLLWIYYFYYVFRHFVSTCIAKTMYLEYSRRSIGWYYLCFTIYKI